jgi:hypothetical protein
VLADEDRHLYPSYHNSNDYIALPAAQRGYCSKRFSAKNNAVLYSGGEICYKQPSTFQTQIDKIDTGQLQQVGQWVMDWDLPEPTDVLLEMCVDSANANYPFAGAWRANVAKYVFIYTDTLPSGAR